MKIMTYKNKKKKYHLLGNKHLLARVAILLLATFAIHKIQADPQEVFARSYMFTRPGYAHLHMQQSLWHDLIYDKHGTLLGGFQAIGFYTHSISADKSAHYFLPNCKTNQLVAGDNTDKKIKDARDIRAEWLNLDSAFQGSFSIDPEQTQSGLLLEYNQNLNKFFDMQFFKNYWVSISVPIVRVENNLNLKQNIQHASTTEGQPKDLIEAFRQPAWQYSKITGKNSRTSAAEFRFNLGSSLVDKDYFQLGYRSTFVIPTGNKPNPKELFDPVVGNGRHFGIGGAIFFQFPLNQNTPHTGICFFANLEGIFLVRNKQDRTFDLKQFDNDTLTYTKKPWSRFLKYNEKIGRQNIPGVNILTRRAVVRPYGIFDFSMGYRIKYGILEAEIGYNVWGKSSETVELRSDLNHPCECYKEFGIAGNPLETDQTTDGRVQNTSASLSDISMQEGLNQEDETNRFDQTEFTHKATFISVKHSDINPQSAAAGSALNQKLHASVGAIFKGDKVDALLGGGAFADLPHKNSTLKMWGAWVKFGATF